MTESNSNRSVSVVGLVNMGTALAVLASIPSLLRQLAGRLKEWPGEGDNSVVAAEGLAQVEAARGCLIHRVQIDDGVFSNYQILAPTEWNFHPQGLIREALGSLGDCESHEREQLARIVINAIDPCVGYESRIH